MSTNNGNKPEQKDVDVESKTTEEMKQKQGDVSADENDAQVAEKKTTEEATSEANGETLSLEAALEKAEAKANANWERVLRMQADMDNLRRRKEQEISDVRKFAVKDFVESLIPVMDSLEMGLSVDGDLKAIREGMQMTQKQFLAALAKHKVEVESPEGQPFDPERHQAMTMQPSKEHKDNEVITVLQKGYVLNGRLVRPAMVVVCKNE